MRDEFAEACEMLAKSVADDVHHFTKQPCGYVAKVVEKFERVEFTFRVGVNDDDAKYSCPMKAIIDLKSAVSWQPIFEDLLRIVLMDTAPLALAERLARVKEKGWEPEVPVYIDQKGKRHFTLKADTGYLDGVFSSIRMTKGATPP